MTVSNICKHRQKKLGRRRALYQGSLILLALLLSTTLFSQITIRKKSAPLEVVLSEIRNQTGYQFLYGNEIKKLLREISIDVENVSIETFLKKCFGPYPVSYNIVNKTILLKIRNTEDPAGTHKEMTAGQKEIQGKVTDMQGKPLSMATIQLMQSDINTTSREDGNFSIPLPVVSGDIVISVSYVGKATLTKTIVAGQLNTFQLIRLNELNLKLPEVEINGVRKKTGASNSSVVFDKQAIEQAQALSVGDVLRYMPGQSMIRPGAALQGASVITMRSAAPINSEQSMNNAFGINMQIDGNAVNNNANMQMMNPSRNGLMSANLTPPNTLGDLSQKNGSFNSDYKGDVANNGIDLRQIQSENIESIEVVTGVASARYGDYSTGVILINRQAGLTPFRLNLRTNEGTVNAGVNKGFAISPSLGVMNISFDYLNSNDDPRNKLKSFQRIGGNMLWTLYRKKANQFKNTLSIDYNTTIDRTRLDPDDGNDRLTKFNDRNIRVSNRSELIFKKPWLYSLQLQLSYNRQRQESYSQYYLNTRNIIGIADAVETKTYEGYFAPGYYMAVQHVIGEPVNASGRLELTSFFKTKGLSYKLLLGVTHDYNANKGPGTLIFDDKPRFYQTGNKNDRARSFNFVPTMRNTGFYMENTINTRILNRYFTVNAGVRGDIQNKFFTLSPRLNASWKLFNSLAWNFSYGIATKAPGLSQISPGNVYIDIPLVNAYTGNADQSVYLVHTEVIQNNNNQLRPYKSITYETGFNLDLKPIHASAFYFHRLQNNSFASISQVVPITLPNYAVTTQTGQKPTYAPDGTYKTYTVGYNKILNGNYNGTSGVELMVATDKIKSLSTSLSMNTAMYWSNYYKDFDEVYVPDPATVDYTQNALYGVYRNQRSKAVNIKSTITSTTHIPSLRMALMLTGELFWVNRTEDLMTSVYPVGYYTRDMQYVPLSSKDAEQSAYAHLLRSAKLDAVTYRPAALYPNIHLRLSKEIGDFLRFSFNAFNVLNIRPDSKSATGSIYYYNGRSAYGTELIFTIK